MQPTVMLIGLGDLGNHVLQLLVKEEEIGRIIVCSRNQKRGKAYCNLARLSALAQGFSPSLRFETLDIRVKEAVIEIVVKEKPDIILSTATMQTWWLPNLLPPEQATLIKSAGFGMWLPVHMTLTLKLMESLHDLDYRGITLTAPYPDVVNCVLGRINMAPTSGVGNIDEIVPKVQLLAAKKLKTSSTEVQIILVAHHALESMVFDGPQDEIPPYFLRIYYRGEDVTDAVRGDKLLLSHFPLPSGPAIHLLTASSILRIIRGLLSEGELLLHAPGPLGLPGGYPIIVSSKGIKLASIQGLSLEEAISINERSHRFDGIESVEEDGAVVFSSEASEILRVTLGYDCKRLVPGESEERAEELIARFREYAQRHGVNL